VKSTTVKYILGAILVIVLVASISLYIWYSHAPSTPPLVQVTKCFIDPTTVTVGQLATIHCETQSTDKNDTHEITVEFSIQSTELIAFSSGSSNSLSHPSPYVWQYTDTLGPLGTYSQPTTVNATLQSGYSSANYEIQVTFYSNNTQFANRTLDLAVKNS
jgi:hypothetical protein